jgi:hypothetical protein
MHRTRFFFALVALATLAAPLLACSGQDGGSSGSTNGELSLGQVFADLGPRVCDKLQQCNPSGFAQSFPNGTSDCLATFDKGDPAPDRVVPCTQSQADTCGADIEQEDCSDLLPPAGGSGVLPASCKGC